METGLRHLFITSSSSHFFNKTDFVQNSLNGVFTFQNFELKVMSTVVNDTVGTMVSCAYDHHKTCMGLIVGMFDQYEPFVDLNLLLSLSLFYDI